MCIILPGRQQGAMPPTHPGSATNCMHGKVGEHWTAIEGIGEDFILPRLPVNATNLAKK